MSKLENLMIDTIHRLIAIPEARNALWVFHVFNGLQFNEARDVSRHGGPLKTRARPRRDLI